MDTIVTVLVLLCVLSHAAPLVQHCLSATFHYKNSTLQCSDYCPPKRITDRNVFYCWKICRSYVLCLLKSKANSLEVTTALDLRQNSGENCTNSTYLYQPRQRTFNSCLDICSIPSNSGYCKANCPDFYSCVNRKKTETLESGPSDNNIGWSSTATELSVLLRTAGLPTDETTLDSDPPSVSMSTSPMVIAIITTTTSGLLVLIVIIAVCIVKFHIIKNHTAKKISDNIDRQQTTGLVQGDKEESSTDGPAVSIGHSSLCEQQTEVKQLLDCPRYTDTVDDDQDQRRLPYPSDSGPINLVSTDLPACEAQHHNYCCYQVPLDSVHDPEADR